MKVSCLILFLFALCCTCLTAQSVQKERRQARGRDPLANGLKSLDRQKTLLTGKRLSLTGNFSYRRNVLPVRDEYMVQRTSSYALPVLLGRKLNGNWSVEAGPFAGINRHVFQRSGMLKTEVAPRAAQLEFTFGLLVGVSHRLGDHLALQLSYRKDFGAGKQAWQPIQLGWNLTF